MTRQNLQFLSGRNSIEQILGVTTDDNLTFELISQTFSNPSGDVADRFDTFLVSGDFEFDLDLGLALNLGESSLGDIEVDYPIFTDVILPELVVLGDAFSIETGEDFVVDGAEITAESLNFDQFVLEFFTRSDGAALRNVSLFNAGFGTGIGIPIDFEIDPFDVTVPIFEVFGGEVSDDIIDGLSFRLGAPEGVEKTGEQFGLGAPGDLDDAAVLIFEPLAELRLDPLQLLGNFPQFGALDLLQVSLDESFPFLGSIISAEFDLTILSPLIAAGFAVSQSFVFDPTAVTTNVVIEGETQSAELGADFTFGGFDVGDEAIQDGTLDGSITFDLQGDILTDVTLQPIGSIGVEVLSVGGSLAINDDDPFEAQLGPFFEDRIDIPINAFVIDVIDDLRINLPDDFFAPVSIDFSIPIVAPSAPELIDQPEVLQVSADQDSPLVFAPMIVNDVDTLTPIELRLTVADGELSATSTAVVSVSGAGSSTVTLVGLEADLTDFLGGGGLIFRGDQDTTLNIVADDRDGFSGITFPEIELIVSDAGGNATAGSGNADRLSAFDINGNGENDPEDDGNTPVSFSGGGGNDTLIGGNRNDFLSGGTGDDNISGGDGADDIFGGANDDEIFAGDGNDRIRGDDGDDTIDGGEGDNRIEGGAGDDVISGGAGDDVLMGDEGDDAINGGGGSDFAVGGAGNDQIFAETAIGGAGNDTLRTDGDDGAVFGGAGNDQGRSVLIFGGAGDDEFDGDFTLDSQFFGGLGDDEFDGGAGNDTAFGEEDDDDLSGGQGDDILDGGAGRSTLIGGDGDDTLIADEQDDQLDGGAGSDSIEAGAGDDRIFAGAGFEGDVDIVFAGVGNDTVFGGFGQNNIFGGEGDDVIRTAGDGNVIQDLVGDNQITGSLGADMITTGAGDDDIEGRAGTDEIRSGAGNDLLIATTFNQFSVTEPGAALLDGGVGDDTLIGMQTGDMLFGDEGDDVIFALGELPNVVNGGAGEDQLRIGLDQTFEVDAFGEEDRALRRGDFFDDRIAVEFDFSANRVTDLQTGEVLHQFETLEEVERIIIQRNATAQEFTSDDGQTIDTAIEQDVIIGSDADDNIAATRGGANIFGGLGDDTLFGGGSSLTLPDGTVLVNELFGGAGDDQIIGGTFVDGGEGVDIIDSGRGDDTVIADAADFFVDGGRGDNDLIDGSMLADQAALVIDLAGDFDIDFAHRGENQFLRLGEEFAPLDGFESARGRDGANDVLLTISGEDNFLEGLGGDDTLGVQGAIGTRIDGGAGTDTLALLGNRVFVNLEVILGEPGGASGTVRSLKFPIEGNFNELISIENIIGADANNEPFELEGDSLTGNSLANLIAGRAGNDTIKGLGGADTILGGEGRDLIDGGDGDDRIEANEGRDTLTGGAGADTFSFVGDIGSNLINDFELGADRIEIIVADPAAISFRTFFDGDGQLLSTTITVEGDDTFGRISIVGIDEEQARQAVFQIAPRAVDIDNIAPSAVDDVVEADEDASILIDVLGNDRDDDDDDVTVFAVSAPANGAAVIEGDAIRYTPDADFTGADTFTYDISDGRGGVAQAKVTIDVAAANDAPKAQPDQFTIQEDEVLRGSLFADNGAGLDADIDGDQIAVANINGQVAAVGDQIILNGGSILSVAADGSFEFDPNGAFDFLNNGETAEARFYYTLSDGELQDQAAVFVTVQGVSDDDVAEQADPGIGGDGDEAFFGGAEADVQSGGAGNDTLSGAGGADSLSGDDGDDLLLGGDGADTLRGGGGRDTLEGGSGRDQLVGNGGDDTVKGGGGGDNLRGNGGADVIRGNGGNDVIRAGGGEDNVRGGGGADLIFGGGGADNLSGGGGVDTLRGNGGDDTLKGNGGADVFQFRASDRNDTISDFRQGQDKIQIQSGANAFAGLDIQQDGRDVLIGFGAGQVRVVTDNANAFDENDFIF